MRVMLKLEFDVAAGNRSVQDGSLPKLIQEFIQKHKPEASYFLPSGGTRSAIFFLDLKDASHTFASGGNTAAKAIDGDPQSGWSIAGGQGRGEVLAGLQVVGRVLEGVRPGVLLPRRGVVRARRVPAARSRRCR